MYPFPKIFIFLEQENENPITKQLKKYIHPRLHQQNKGKLKQKTSWVVEKGKHELNELGSKRQKGKKWPTY